MEIKVEDTEDEKPSVSAKKKSRRGKQLIRPGIRDRKTEKERQQKERQRNQTSPEEALQTLEEVLQIAEEQLQTSEDVPAVVEVPAPPSCDEGSMSRSSSLL